MAREDISTPDTLFEVRCIMWSKWFKGFDGLLTGGLSMPWDEDLFVLINLAFQIYYRLIPNEFLWKRYI
jgi:hypothetical protein